MRGVGGGEIGGQEERLGGIGEVFEGRVGEYWGKRKD